jgi:hypothetical protein
MMVKFFPGSTPSPADLQTLICPSSVVGVVVIAGIAADACVVKTEAITAIVAKIDNIFFIRKVLSFWWICLVNQCVAGKKPTHEDLTILQT